MNYSFSSVFSRVVYPCSLLQIIIIRYRADSFRFFSGFVQSKMYVYQSKNNDANSRYSRGIDMRFLEIQCSVLGRLETDRVW